MNHQQRNYRPYAHIHQQHQNTLPPSGSYPASGYPPIDIHTPYADQASFQQQSFAPTEQASSSSIGGLLGGGRAGQMFGELQGFVTRMGGIDGILNTVGKVQKLMSTVQQITPMLGLLMKKKSSTSSSSDYDSGSYRRRRRKRRGSQRSSKNGNYRRRSNSTRSRRSRSSRRRRRY